MSELVRAMIVASEKAGNIARLIRADKKLFNLLVQEKTGDDKNHRFFQDFKTLADVLIQESLRHDIATMFPDMKDNIYGEENNTFSNALGATITVKVDGDKEALCSTLFQVLDGDMEVAELLAEEVQKQVEVHERETSLLPHDLIDSYENIGIWIDPIDATYEYVKGSEQFDKICHENFEEEDQVWACGLHCVSVLIGAFDLKTGQPLIGVINQPFWKYDAGKGRWTGRFFWGLSMKDTSVSTLTRYPLPRNEGNFPKRHTVILSSNEDAAVVQKLLKTNFRTIVAAGAGYKMLCVALGHADAYLLSKDSVHLWDICGPHSILNSLGGGLVNYTSYCFDEAEPSKKISYDPRQKDGKESHFVVKGGILAFRDAQVAASIKECILSVVDPTPLTSPTCEYFDLEENVPENSNGNSDDA